MSRADADLVFERSGRSWTALAVLLAVWAGLLAAFLLLDAALWIVAALLALSLPAAWDFARGHRAGLEADRQGIRWYSGRRAGSVAWGEVDHVRLNRRLDLSMRVSLVLHDGARIRLPQESLPPTDRLEAALAGFGVRVQRHPFSLL